MYVGGNADVGTGCTGGSTTPAGIHNVTGRKHVGQGDTDPGGIHSNLNRTGGTVKYLNGVMPQRGKKVDGVLFVRTFVHTKRRSAMDATRKSGWDRPSSLGH